MFELMIRPAATEMMAKAHEWYEEQQPALGERFLREIDHCFDKLEADPYLYAVIKKQYRQILLKNFPYVIVFKVIEAQVLILSVFHTSRNPRKKFKS